MGKFDADMNWVFTSSSSSYTSLLLFLDLACFKKYTQTIEKGEYSFDGKKGFFTARLQIGPLPGDSISCNFILSVEGSDTEDPVWLVDSILIRPQSMRRRRRK